MEPGARAQVPGREGVRKGRLTDGGDICTNRTNQVQDLRIYMIYMFEWFCSCKLDELHNEECSGHLYSVEGPFSTDTQVLT